MKQNHCNYFLIFLFSIFTSSSTHSAPTTEQLYKTKMPNMGGKDFTACHIISAFLFDALSTSDLFSEKNQGIETAETPGGATKAINEERKELWKSCQHQFIQGKSVNLSFLKKTPNAGILSNPQEDTAKAEEFSLQTVIRSDLIDGSPITVLEKSTHERLWNNNIRILEVRFEADGKQEVTRKLPGSYNQANLIELTVPEEPKTTPSYFPALIRHYTKKKKDRIEEIENSDNNQPLQTMTKSKMPRAIKKKHICEVKRFFAIDPDKTLPKILSFHIFLLPSDNTKHAARYFHYMPHNFYFTYYELRKEEETPQNLEAIQRLKRRRLILKPSTFLIRVEQHSHFYVASLPRESTETANQWYKFDPLYDEVQILEEDEFLKPVRNTSTTAKAHYPILVTFDVIPESYSHTAASEP